MKEFKYILLTFLVASSSVFGASVELPMKHAQKIENFIGSVLSGINKLMIPIIVLAIIYVGFLFIKAQGNEKELGDAKSALLYVLIGVGVIVVSNGAYHIFLAAAG